MNIFDNMMMDELLTALEQHPTHYREVSSLWGYLHHHAPQGEIFRALFERFPPGESFLDIGPGDGTAMDVAMELGATTIHFIDKDPIILRYCQLKGYMGIMSDYEEYPILAPWQYDLILSRGSLNSDGWNANRYSVSWKTWLKVLMTTRYKTLVITPTFDSGEPNPNTGQVHTCFGEKRKKYDASDFHHILIDSGFVVHDIQGYTDEYNFPYTYIHTKQTPL